MVFKALFIWSLRSCFSLPLPLPQWSHKRLPCALCQGPHRFTPLPEALALTLSSVAVVFPSHPLPCSPIGISARWHLLSESFAWLFCVSNSLTYIRYYLFVFCLYPFLKMQAPSGQRLCCITLAAAGERALAPWRWPTNTCWEMDTLKGHGPMHLCTHAQLLLTPARHAGTVR